MTNTAAATRPTPPLSQVTTANTPKSVDAPPAWLVGHRPTDANGKQRAGRSLMGQFYANNTGSVMPSFVAFGKYKKSNVDFKGRQPVMLRDLLAEAVLRNPIDEKAAVLCICKLARYDKSGQLPELPEGYKAGPEGRKQFAELRKNVATLHNKFSLEGHTYLATALRRIFEEPVITNLKAMHDAAGELERAGSSSADRVVAKTLARHAQEHFAKAAKQEGVNCGSELPAINSRKELDKVLQETRKASESGTLKELENARWISNDFKTCMRLSDATQEEKLLAYRQFALGVSEAVASAAPQKPSPIQSAAPARTATKVEARQLPAPSHQEVEAEKLEEKAAELRARRPRAEHLDPVAQRAEALWANAMSHRREDRLEGPRLVQQALEQLCYIGTSELGLPLGRSIVHKLMTDLGSTVSDADRITRSRSSKAMEQLVGHLAAKYETYVTEKGHYTERSWLSHNHKRLIALKNLAQA